MKVCNNCSCTASNPKSTAELTSMRYILDAYLNKVFSSSASTQLTNPPTQPPGTVVSTSSLGVLLTVLRPLTNHFKTTLSKTMPELFQDYFNTTLIPPNPPFITTSRLLGDYLKNYLSQCQGHLKYFIGFMECPFPTKTCYYKYIKIVLNSCVANWKGVKEKK